MNFFRDFKSQKRGVSGVITAVLLILLVIAAIGILWVVVQNFVQEGSAGVSGQADCLTTSFEVVSASAANGITVRRTGGDAVLTAIRVSDGDLTKDGATANPAVGETSIATGFGFASGATLDVSIAYDIGDTSCQLESLGSVQASL
jgi:flagellin-like protein